MRGLALPPAVEALQPFPTVTRERFQAALTNALGESGSEWFRAVDWHPNLWAAREAAVATGKPIFIWSMNGHPLGST